MAARSLRLTASARCPSERGGLPGRKWTLLDQRVGGLHQFMAGLRAQQRRVIADPQHHIGAHRAQVRGSIVR